MKNIDLHKLQGIVGVTSGVSILVLSLYMFISQVPYNVKYIVALLDLIATSLVAVLWLYLRVKSNTKGLIIFCVIVLFFNILLNSFLKQYVLSSNATLQLFMLSFSSIIIFSDGFFVFWKRNNFLKNRDHK